MSVGFLCRYSINGKSKGIGEGTLILNDKKGLADSDEGYTFRCPFRLVYHLNRIEEERIGRGTWSLVKS